MHLTKRRRVYGGFRDSMGMGIPWGFSQVFLWVWGLKSNPRGSPENASNCNILSKLEKKFLGRGHPLPAPHPLAVHLLTPLAFGLHTYFCVIRPLVHR